MKQIINLGKTGINVLASILLLTACQKETSPTQPAPPASAKIKKVTSDDAVMEFGYDANGNVQSIKTNNDITTGGMMTTYDITYGAGKKITELKGAAGEKIVPHYADNKLISAEIFDANGDLVANTDYSYQNNVLKSVFTETQVGFAMKFSFTTNAAGNVTKTDISFYNPLTDRFQLSTSTEYEYDNKVNPLNNIKELMYLFLINPNQNNITKETERDAQQTVTETREYAYSYNSNNLPTGAAVKVTEPGKPATNSTMVFLYQ